MKLDKDDLKAYPKTIDFMRDWQWLQLSVEAMTVFTEIDPAFLLPDEVWQRVKTAIPPDPPKPKGGRPRMDNRQALDAIFYLLRTGCQWKALPRCLGAASTVHDRFQLWVEQGVFERMWELGLEQYAEEVGID